MRAKNADTVVEPEKPEEQMAKVQKGSCFRKAMEGLNDDPKQL